ncbi:MAG: hypothetical protein QOH15_104 [Gaiellales bacterium]|nr:hypothetical protein [Gaiellales bacterium]
MSRTVFYALDPTRLTDEDEELSNLFVQLHALTSDQPDGPVAKIVATDLLLALDAWSRIDGHGQGDPHEAAVLRILAAIGEDTNALAG